ncbi:MAG TPA: prepilin-type cleavage/methylation domain-containing protein, partial [Archangium sp.]
GLNAGSVTKDCSFCTGSGVARRGAIVFNGDGAVRFVDGSGNPVYVTSGGFSIQNTTAATKQVTLFGIAAATGYVGVYQ